MNTQRSNYPNYNNQQQIELSLESRVFLAYKYRTPNRRKLLQKLLRSGVNIETQLTDKTKFISAKAEKVAYAALNQIISGKGVLWNHKYLSMITRCKSSAQNNNITNELANLFDIKYHNFLYRDGSFYRHHIEFTISTSILGELRNEDIENSEFYPKKISSSSIKNKNTFNKSIRSNESTFLENPNPLILQSETLNLVETENEDVTEEGGKEATIHPLKPNKPQQSVRPANQRKKSTNAEYKAKRGTVYHFKQYDKPKNLADHYPLTDADCSVLQSKSGRDFTPNAINQILLALSEKSKTKGHEFPSKASFMVYMSKILINEKRDAVKTSNLGFKINANLTVEDIVERAHSAKIETYLSEVETKAITNRSDETQFRAKIVGALGARAYNILPHLVSIEEKGEVFKLHLSKELELTEQIKYSILKEANAVDGFKGVERLEFVFPEKEISIEEWCREDDTTIPSFNSGQSESLELPQGVWGKISKELVAKYGVDVYRNWFKKLTATVDENTKTIELRVYSEFVKDWIVDKYENTIAQIAATIGFELKRLR